jgi:Zn-dependent M28 family amino/carboxypeptidase
MGTVRGTSDEVLIVNAHLDGWYDAAGDNGDGTAVLVALARHFSRPENRPARTLVFVASGGHHSTGLNGPGHFVSMNAALAGRAVLVLNLEHIAQFEVDPETFEVRRTEQSMGWGVTNMAPALLALTDRAKERYGFRLRPQYSTSVAGDLGGYAPLGVPRVQAIHAGPLYHTSGDVLKTISVHGLERAARFYAHWVEGVTEMSRADIDP